MLFLLELFAAPPESAVEVQAFNGYDRAQVWCAAPDAAWLAGHAKVAVRVSLATLSCDDALTMNLVRGDDLVRTVWPAGEELALRGFVRPRKARATSRWLTRQRRKAERDGSVPPWTFDYLLGRLAFANEQWEEAVDALEAVVDSDAPEAVRNMAEVRRRLAFDQLAEFPHHPNAFEPLEGKGYARIHLPPVFDPESYIQHDVVLWELLYSLERSTGFRE